MALAFCVRCQNLLLSSAPASIYMLHITVICVDMYVHMWLIQRHSVLHNSRVM